MFYEQYSGRVLRVPLIVTFLYEFHLFCLFFNEKGILRIIMLVYNIYVNIYKQVL